MGFWHSPFQVFLNNPVEFYGSYPKIELVDSRIPRRQSKQILNDGGWVDCKRYKFAKFVKIARETILRFWKPPTTPSIIYVTFSLDSSV